MTAHGFILSETFFYFESKCIEKKYKIHLSLQNIQDSCKLRFFLILELF